MPRYKATIEYLGTGLSGFQTQANAPSVQEFIESSIEKFSHEKVTIYAAGRTDAGVHAYGQVIHFDLEKHIEPHIALRALNHFLKPNISVISCEIAEEDFHARFSAKKRHYLYRILNRESDSAIDQNRIWHVKHPLDVSAMIKASEYLIGMHDFTSFRCSACQAKSPVKTISKIDISKVEDEVHFRISAPSFLHNMVRNIVGTLVMVGTSKWKIEDVKTALEAKDRRAAGPTAPAHGLYFMKVDY
ncbi:MAG: tRNA pseudouridine(38-40) synthase TruA [Rickettsiaceae bacterium]|nr:tRNA pseudouridine(38-40) synthase TruA [Rickettsiaceae bacterium]